MPAAHAPRYYGADSHALGRLSLAAWGEVLDVCAGVGAQTLLAARVGIHATGVDINAAVADLFAFHAALNGLETRVSLRIGELDDVIRPGERFRHLTCNPPMIPVPADIPYPLTGNGGPSGDAFTVRVLARLRDLLHPTGTATFLGMCVGAHDPDVSTFQPLAAEHDLRLNCIFCSETAVEDGDYVSAAATTVAGYVGGTGPAWERRLIDDYNAMGVKRIFTYALFARLVPPGAGGVLTSNQWLRAPQPWRL